MTLDQAQEIIYDNYAEFLQSDSSRFEAIFPLTTTYYLLPYPQKYIREAMDILIDYCKKNGKEKELKAIENAEPNLWFIKGEEESMVKILEDEKWKNLSADLIKGFQENPNQISYIERYLDGKFFNEVNFDNLNSEISDKLLRIFANFYKDAHYKLSILFNQKIPETLLPFSKIKLIKLIDFYVKIFEDKNDDKKEDFIEIKNMINEEYIDNDIAIKEFMENISKKEAGDSIIINLQKYQLDKIQKLLS